MAKLLICTVGLPRSGKSTWARSQVNTPIVNPDSIRLAIHGRSYVAEAEKYVWAIAETMVKSLFLAGHDTVILDATNTTRKRRDAWQSDSWATVFHFVATDRNTCLSRASDVLKPIICSMAEKFEELGDGENMV